MAVTRVRPAGHHFTAYYDEVEVGMVRLRVTRDPAGHLTIATEGGGFGGDVVPRSSPIPPDVRPLAQELEAELKARCTSARNWQLRYKGWYRTVIVEELIAGDVDGRGTRRGGWKATVTVSMDESLTRIMDIEEGLWGFGSIDLPGDAHWLALPEPSGRPRLLTTSDRIHGLSQQIGEAARSHDARAPAPSLASLVPTDAPMVPSGFVSQAHVKVTLYRRVPNRSDLVPEDLIAPLDLHGAVFGASASGDATIMAGPNRYRLHATLSPSTPRTPQPGQSSDEYAGTLTLRLEDDHGHAWDRTYSVRGKLELEGETVVAPWGLTIPDIHSDYQAGSGYLPGPGGSGVRFHLDPSLADDPRR